MIDTHDRPITALSLVGYDKKTYNKRKRLVIINFLHTFINILSIIIIFIMYASTNQYRFLICGIAMGLIEIPYLILNSSYKSQCRRALKIKPRR